MSTGYTSDAMECDMTFREFALRCTRAFAYVSEFRDEPLDKIFTKVPRRTFYQRKLKDAKKEKALFEEMSKDEKLAWAKNSLIEKLKVARKYMAQSKLENARLEKLLVEAKAFRPPTSEHIRYRDFMIEQLTGSLHDLSYALEDISKLEATNPIDVLIAREKSIDRDIAYYAESQNRDDNMVDMANKWIGAIIQSLPSDE